MYICTEVLSIYDNMRVARFISPYYKTTATGEFKLITKIIFLIFFSFFQLYLIICNTYVYIHTYIHTDLHNQCGK